MKGKIKVVYIIECVCLSIFLIWLILLVFNILNKLNIINTKYIQWILSSIAVIVLIVYCIKTRKKSIIMFYIMFKKIARVLNINIFLQLFSSSLDIESTMDYGQAKDLISIQWSIFGISIALFIFWHVYKTKYLYEKIKVEDMQKISINEFYRYAISKINAQFELVNQFFPIILLIINFIALIVSTHTIYFGNNEILNAKEVLVKLSFYLSTNSLTSLLLDIILPLLVLRNELLNKSKINKREYELFAKINETKGIIESIKKSISDSPEIDEIKKAESLSKLDEFEHEMFEEIDFNSNQQVEENKET